jgi:hypothetical protein
MIEAIPSTETSVVTRATRHHIPENGILHIHKGSMQLCSLVYLLMSSKCSMSLTRQLIASYSNLTSVPLSDWCTADCTRFSTATMSVVAYTRKTNILSYNYQLCWATITRPSSIKDLGVFFHSKLHFHNHVDYVFS